MSALLYTNKLSYGSPAAKFTAKVEKFKTDSYSIRAAVGINNVEEVFDLSWAGLTEIEATALVAQLKSAKGVELLQWSPPLESATLNFTVAQFSANEYAGEAGYYTIAATLNREFDN